MCACLLLVEFEPGSPSPLSRIDMKFLREAKPGVSNNGSRGVTVLRLVHLIVEALQMPKKLVCRSLVQVADRLSTVPNPVRQHSCSEVWLGEQCHLYHFSASAYMLHIIFTYYIISFFPSDCSNGIFDIYPY